MPTSQTSHKSQHWIPQSYLKPWCDPDAPANQTPYVWCFTKDGQSAKKKAPKKLFTDKDLYTIHLPDGTRDLTVEHGFAGLESDFASIRDNLLSKQQPLDEQSDSTVRLFVATMRSRIPNHLLHFQDQFKKVQDMMDSMRKQMWSLGPIEYAEQIKKMGPLMRSSKTAGSYEDVKQVAEGPIAPIAISMIEAQFPILMKMNLAVLYTDCDLGFITSDQPCSWFDVEWHKKPPLFRNPALLDEQLQITLPVSPSQLLLLSWHPIIGYNKITKLGLDDMNRRARFLCNEYFVTRRREKLDIWFDPGAPPVE